MPLARGFRWFRVDEVVFSLFTLRKLCSQWESIGNVFLEWTDYSLLRGQRPSEIPVTKQLSSIGTCISLDDWLGRSFTNVPFHNKGWVNNLWPNYVKSSQTPVLTSKFWKWHTQGNFGTVIKQPKDRVKYLSKVPSKTMTTQARLLCLAQWYHIHKVVLPQLFHQAKDQLKYLWQKYQVKQWQVKPDPCVDFEDLKITHTVVLAHLLHKAKDRVKDLSKARSGTITSQTRPLCSAQWYEYHIHEVVLASWNTWTNTTEWKDSFIQMHPILLFWSPKWCEN